MTEPLHITFFIRGLTAGGAERMMLNLAEGMTLRGHRVDIVVAEGGQPLEAELPAGVGYIVLETPRKLKTRVGLLSRFPIHEWSTVMPLLAIKPPTLVGYLPLLERYLAQARPDAMISVMDFGTLIALWAGRRASPNTIQIVSEQCSPTPLHGRSRKRHRSKLGHLSSVYYPQAAGIVAVSDGVADDLSVFAGLPRNSITTIFNPVVRHDVAEASRARVDHPWFHDSGPPIVLGVGRLAGQKDFPNLLRAFGLLRRERDVRLLILGEGKERKALEALVEELGIGSDVALPGFVANIPAYMARAQLFVLSSAYEGLPTVLIEAMACGCPAVSTDCPSGPREILDNGKYGEIVPVADPVALAGAMARSLDAPPQPDVLQNAAMRFSCDRSVDAYLDLVERLRVDAG